MKKLLMSIFISALFTGCSNHDRMVTDLKVYYNVVVKELSSEKYFGRSDYGNGDVMAAKYIIDELSAAGAQPVQPKGTSFKAAYPVNKSAVMPFGEGRWSGEDAKYLDYLQHFSYPLNVMRGEMELSVDGVELEPTVDYIVKEFSPSCCGEFEIYTLEEEYYNPEKYFELMNSGRFKRTFVLIDWDLFRERMPLGAVEIYQTYFCPLEKVGGLILQQKEQFPFFKARSYYTTPMPVLMVNGSFPDKAEKLKICIESEMLPEHDAHNIVATIKGGRNPEKRVLLTAHYDHLELMGKENLFAGANDNASGVAMLLSLAKYYSANTPDCTIDFAFFDGEEENLLGAFYYAENPPFPLGEIKYAINIDMIGDTGDTLICEISEEGRPGMDLFVELNSRAKEPFDGIKCNSLSDNSDHFALALKNVPVIYFTVEGEYYKYYHTPRDIYENTSDVNFKRIFNLVETFIREYE